MWRACVIVVVGGCASDASLIRSDFSASFQCPANQIDVRPADHRDAYRATGCGFDIHYNCASTPVPDGNGGYQDARSCGARQRMEYQATDGTSHETWFDDEVHSSDRMSIEAALASATHDIPCDRASLKVIATDDHGFANDVAGCGQRVRYQISEVGAQPAPGPIGPVRKHKYILIDRYPLTAPPAP